MWVISHLVFGAALGSLLMFFAQLAGAETTVSLEYGLIAAFFGSAASVIYKIFILRL
jgi:hypothetical protein